MEIEVMITTSKIKKNLENHFPVEPAKKQKKIFCFVDMDINGGGHPCQTSKKAKEKAFMTLAASSVRALIVTNSSHMK